MSLGWQVLAAMIAAANAARSSMVLLITLDTLEYLHKGGRIGGASHFIGNLLNLKPQILVDHQSGQVEAGRRSRTRTKALADLYEDFFAQIQEEFQPEELILGIVSPILGVHTGPRAVAICSYTE